MHVPLTGVILPLAVIRPLYRHLNQERGLSLFLLMAFICPLFAAGQVFSLTDGAAYTQCQGAICDPGGAAGGYSNNADLVATLCPTGGASSGPATTVRFVEWNIAPGPGDCLKIHQGTTTSGPPFLTGSHNNSLLDHVVVSSHPSGCLTFNWTTDATGTSSGWQAVVLTGPQAGEDASADVATNAVAFAMLDSLEGFPEVGGAWTAPGGASCDGTFDPAVDPYGEYIYSVPAEATCPGHSARLSVQPPQNTGAGTNGTLILCTTSGVADLFAALGGDPDPGGTWTAPGGTVTDATFDPLVDPPGVYTYTVPCDPEPCVDPTATVTVTVHSPPSAGTSSTTSTCSNAVPFDLFVRLGGTPNTGGAWTGPGGSPVSSTFTPGTSASGVYTYTVLGSLPCPNATATVTVTVVNAPNAGTGASFTVCSNAASFALTSRLGGTPQTGGTWTGPAGAHGPTFVPGTDVAGTYTYTVAGTAPCTAATAVLTISVQAAPRAGTNASTIVCSTDASFSLFGLLTGSPSGGGSWTAPGGATFTGTFIPGTSAPGVYTYTVAGVPPCANATATVSVAVNTAPNAGTNTTVVRCSNAPQFNLFALLGGSPSPGGTWSGPAGANNGTFIPGTSDAGAYTYTVTGTAPCANATAVVTVNIVAAPRAGTNGTATVCASDAPFALFGRLGGVPDAGGTWTAPGGGSSTGTFTPGTSVSGAYTYTVVGNTPCANATATVTVSVIQPPNPGVSATLTVCSNGSSINLFGVLTGSPATGGTWTRPGGQAHTGTLAPSTDPAGTYTYTVSGTTPCTARSSTVQVTKVQAPDAGANGSITVCSTMAPFQLFTVLGGTPSGSGTWRTPANAPFSGTFTPGTTPAGIYKYVVLGTAPCANDTGFVTVVVNTAPNAGTNASHQVCSNQPSFNLITRLGGTPNSGGTWTGPDNLPFPGTYVPGTSAPGAYTYTVSGASPCLDASAVVSITQQRQPVAGTNASFSICSTEPAVDLFGRLGGSPDSGGSWTAPGGGPSSGVFIPGSSAPGVYTYSLTGVTPCTNATATVAVTVNQAPDAGVNAAISVCADGGNVNLFNALGGTPALGGTWTDDDATGQLSAGVFTPTGMAPGDYDFTYTVPANGQCPADQSTVRVTIVAALDAGSNGSLTVCGSNNLVDLFPGLGGTPQGGGTWADLSGTGALTGQFFNSTLVPAGTYNFRYTLSGSASCAADDAMVSVTVVAPRRPGNSASTTVCGNSGQFNLFPLLTGNPQTGGSWSPGNGTYNPQTHEPGVFTYTLTGTAPCPNATATITVAEVAAPNAGNSATTNVCSNDGPFNMTLRLGGAPQPGTWTFGGVTHSNIFVPGVDVPGVYVYTVAGNAPCGPAMSTLTVNVNPAPNAGGNGDTTVCSNSSSFALFDLLTGGAMPGGTWTRPGPGGNGHSGFYQPPMDNPGDYTYTITGIAPCASDVAIVTVTENREPKAGLNGTATLCAGGASVNLITFLGGNPDQNGAWSGPAPATTAFNGVFNPGATAPGTYTYTVPGLPPCSPATATVSVFVTQPPNAGTSRTLTVCSNAAPFALVDSLGGTPALNGTWTAPPPTGGNFNGFFTPGTSLPGVYTYTVAGTTPCASVIATVNVNVNPRANAGTNASISVCSNGGAQPLFPLLGAQAQVGGTWRRQATGAIHSGVFQPGTDLAGVFVYTVQGPPGCQPHQATVAVTVNQQPNAGFNGQIIVCDDDDPFQLVNVLNGSPQLNGTWVAPNGDTHTGIYLPGQSTPGVYTYTVLGITPCANATAQVNVIENDRPDAGENGVRTVCSTDAPFSLFTVLTGVPHQTGVWTGPGGGTVGSQFTPGSSPQGVYKYRIQGLAPCESDSATATIIVNTAPNAGISTAVALCSSGSPVALNGLLGGTPGTGGTWTFGNVEHLPFFDPAVDVSGAYVYTMVGLAPCTNAVAQVQITLVPSSNAGTSGTIAACVGDAAILLTNGLGGTPNASGTWNDDDGTGQLTGAILNASNLAPGSYHFTHTVAGNGPCAAATAVVTVVLADALDAGIDASATICENQIIPLFPRIGGTPQEGGYWTDLDNSGALIGGVFNGTLVGANTTWRFRYVIQATATCEADTSLVTITVEEGPFAGCDGFKSFCLSDPPGSLIGSLSCNPDAGGFWLNNLGVAHNGVFQPAIDAPGVYRYIVPEVGGCAADTAQVTVEVRQPADAGLNATPSICSTDSPVDLFTFLGPNAQPGGTWSVNNLTVTGIYNPAVDGPGSYVYRVAGVLPCPADVATVTVSEPLAADAGNSNTYSVCSSDASFNMRLQLGGLPQQGGTWYTQSGATHGVTFNPAVDLGGIYMYVVTGIAPCANDTAYLTVNRSVAPFTGADVTISACATQTAVDLFAALATGAGTGGVWTDLDNTGALIGNIFNPSLVGNGTYHFQYAIAAIAPCINAVSIVTVNVGSGANAGDDNTLTICGAETAFSLFDALDGDPDAGGTWTDGSGTGALLSGGLLNASLLPVGGQSAFVYTIEDPGCGNVHATVFITTVDFPDPGTAEPMVICATDAPIALFSRLGGTPESGGTWSGPGGVFNGTVNPAVAQSGNYSYTLLGNDHCPDTSAVFQITINQRPDAGLTNEVVLCDTLTAFPLITGLNGTPQGGGVWSDVGSSGGLNGSLLNTTALEPDDYEFVYTVTVPGCTAASALLKVMVVSNPVAVDITAECNERERTYVVSFTIEGGDPGTYLIVGDSGTVSTTAPYTFVSRPIVVSRTFVAVVSDANGCAEYNVEVSSPCTFDTDVLVPGSFSPNGDNINETFMIPGIEGFPGNTISIFSRWGAEVFKGEGYDNRTIVWNGSSPDALIPGSAAAGTYFYVLDLGNGTTPLTGFIQLVR